MPPCMPNRCWSVNTIINTACSWYPYSNFPIDLTLLGLIPSVDCHATALKTARHLFKQMLYIDLKEPERIEWFRCYGSTFRALQIVADPLMYSV